MITQSKTETTAGPDGWVGVDDSNLNTQRGGGGFLTLLLFPLIAFSALAFAAAGTCEIAARRSRDQCVTNRPDPAATKVAGFRSNGAYWRLWRRQALCILPMNVYIAANPTVRRAVVDTTID